MVIGRRHVHNLADTGLSQLFFRSTGPFCRVIRRPDPDDAALALHQARRGHEGTQRSRIGQGHRAAGIVFHSQLAVTSLFHEFFVGADEFFKRQGVGFVDDRRDQQTRTIVLGQVNRQSKTNVREMVNMRFTVLQAVTHVDIGGFHQGFHDGVANQVGK